MPVTAIGGANWGDEGKGKMTDCLAADSDLVVRFQGGNNAGHTIINDYGKFALHLLPSGVFYSHITNVLGPGVALNIPALLGLCCMNQLWVGFFLWSSLFRCPLPPCRLLAFLYASSD